MDLRESMRMALIDIRLNKMRTSLSMLGIVIGIASVIIIVAIGNGLKFKILDQFTGMGADRLYVSPMWDRKTQRSGTLTQGDINAIKMIPGVVQITPQLDWNTDVKRGSKSQQMTIKGVAEDFFAISGLKLDYGRLISATDLDYRQKVCILKYTAAENLFGTDTEQKNEFSGKASYVPDQVIGQTLKIGGQRFTVVGILNKEEKGSAFGYNPPNTIFVPSEVLLRMAQIKNINQISVQIDSIKNAKKISKQIKDTLSERHENKGSFYVRNPEDIQKEINTALNIFTAVIGAIGGLSLLVGGIGIMNVMLASVAERTREIGIRKAIGAKRRDIVAQFLIEAGTMTGVGGIIGIILGVLLAKCITILTKNEIPSAIVPTSIIVAFLFSVMVGMFFGIYPASKAANLNPIEALRYE